MCLFWGGGFAVHLRYCAVASTVAWRWPITMTFMVLDAARVAAATTASARVFSLPYARHNMPLHPLLSPTPTPAAERSAYTYL